MTHFLSYLMVYIIQHGSDGLGHELHGLFSCLILNNFFYFHNFHVFFLFFCCLFLFFLEIYSLFYIFPVSFYYVNMTELFLSYYLPHLNRDLYILSDYFPFDTLELNVFYTIYHFYLVNKYSLLMFLFYNNFRIFVYTLYHHCL